jgi:hypothetical protein
MLEQNLIKVETEMRQISVRTYPDECVQVSGPAIALMAACRHNSCQ